MAYNTVAQTGRFTSDGLNRTLSFRQGINWINIYNFTQTAGTNNLETQFYWQTGMGTDVIRWFKTGGANNLNQSTLASAIQEIDTSLSIPGASIATTAITNATQPVVSTGNTAGLVTGSVVRLSSTAAVSNIMGIDFEIDTVNANTNFRVRYVLANVIGAVGGAGFYRRIPFEPQFYPRNRFIVNITQAASAVVTMSVTHGFTVGQAIRFQIPAEFGMIEMDELLGNVTAVNTTLNTITVDIDSSAFTAFTYPLTADVPFTFAQAVPVGEDTAVALSNGANILADATLNTAVLGVVLTGGAGFPAGQTGDVIYWQAGHAFSNIDDL